MKADNVFTQGHQFHRAIISSHSIKGLSHRLFMILLNIGKMGLERIGEQGVMVSDLAKELDLTKPAMSQQLNNLEEKGYIQRVPSKEDRRITLIQLTEAGEEELNVAKRQMLIYLAELEQRMSAEKLKLLGELLEEATTHINLIKQEEIEKWSNCESI